MSDTIELHALLERIGNLLRQELRRAGTDYGLQPVQLEALHYLAVCNRFSDTPQGVSEYLGLTKGTVSQTLKVLEGRGLLRKSPDLEDGRVVHLTLSRTGRRVLEAAIPPALLESASAGLPPVRRRAVLIALRALLAALQAANSGRAFGVCRSCRYHRMLGRGRARCELIGAPLSADDAGRICREYRPAA